MRYLNAAKNVHHGHTMAVMDIDYAPTGMEFVSAGYDRSLRIFSVESSTSRYIKILFICFNNKFLTKFIF